MKSSLHANSMSPDFTNQLEYEAHTAECSTLFLFFWPLKESPKWEMERCEILLVKFSTKLESGHKKQKQGCESSNMSNDISEPSCSENWGVINKIKHTCFEILREISREVCKTGFQTWKRRGKPWNMQAGLGCGCSA